MIVKLWKKFSFWSKLRMILGSLGVSSEITLFLVQAYPQWKMVAAIATGGALLITYLITDEDKDGIVDFFEKKK